MSGLERLIEAANRPLSQSRVVLLARKMSLGEWTPASQSVGLGDIFSKEPGA